MGIAGDNASLAPVDDAAALLEKVIVGGDLSRLSAAERMVYYQRVCSTVGLNPFTQPFAYLNLKGRGLVLYAQKGATDQLRKLHGISIDKVEVTYADDLVIVTVVARTKDARTDSDVGVVPLGHLKGEERANAIMKAVTKAKRRLTLSICGLGMLDETEVDSISGAQRVDLPDAPEGSAGVLGLELELELEHESPAEERHTPERLAERPAPSRGAVRGPQGRTGAPGSGNGASFAQRAGAALGPSDGPSEGHADPILAELRAEVIALLERDGAALDLLKAKGTLPADMTVEQLRKAKDWLLERERRNVPLSVRLGRSIDGAATSEALRAAQQAVQQAKDAKGISQVEYVGLLQAFERRRAELSGPLTSGVHGAAAGAQA